MTVRGLSQKEIPIQEDDEESKTGIVIKEIPGLCLSRVFDPNAQIKGYVVFMRSDAKESESNSTKNFKHYHQNVYTKFIDNARQSALMQLKMLRYADDVTTFDEVPQYLTAVGWLDGAIDQLAAVCQPYISEQCLQYLLLKCKQSAACTGVKQPSDIGDCYKEMKFLELTTSIEDIPEDTLTNVLDELFNEWAKDNVVNLGRKQSILVDFLARLPYMMSKAFSSEKVRASFIRNGTIDSKDYIWPDLFTMIQTKRGEIKDSEVQLIIDSFPKLFPIMEKFGHITESMYDELGFPPDFEEHEDGVN